MSDDDDSSFERIEYTEDGDENTRSASLVETQEVVPEKTKIVVELPPSMTQGNSDKASLQDEGTVKSCLSLDSKLSISYSTIGKFEQLHAASVQKGIGNEENRVNNSDPQEEDTKPSAAYSRKREPRWSMVDYGAHRSKRNNSDDDSFSTWNTNVGVCDFTADAGNDAASVAASSTISGFDLISMGGSKQHACPRCTFVNESHCVVCDVCGFALHANPCLDADSLLAQQLQEQEHRSAFKTVERDEAERQRLWQGESLFLQSQTLTQDVLKYLNERKDRTAIRNAKTADLTKQDIVGYEILPEHSMLILASRFIERFMKHHKKGQDLNLYLRFHFLPKMNGFSLDRVRQDGFLPYSKFSLNADDALKAAMDSAAYTGITYQSSTLASIPEDGGEEPEAVVLPGNGSIKKYLEQLRAPANEKKVKNIFQDKMMYLGCIAAIVKGYDSRDDWNDDDTCITTIQDPCQALPLVFFDASLRNHNGIHRLFSGLLRVCNDFFDPLEGVVQERSEGNPKPSARQRNLDFRDAGNLLPLQRVEQEGGAFPPLEPVEGVAFTPVRVETSGDSWSWQEDAWMDAVAMPGAHTPDRAPRMNDAPIASDEDLAHYFDREQRMYGPQQP
jgi:hypothetical protein